MPLSPIISVRNIGKKYKLGATLGGRNYKTLRDVLTQAAFGPIRKLSAAFRKEPFTGGSQSSPNNPITQSPNNQNALSSAPCSLPSAEASPHEFWALKDISFDVNQGEVVGIIGRNGAGKSTLLKILSEITEPTEGEIRIRGRIASLLEVGTGFHPELSGRENIYMNGAILGMTKAEIDAKFDEIVAFAEVEKFIDTPVKRYSSGMYVRLAFAVAAHLEPEILLVDEVLAVGDIAFQKKCLGKMEDVSQKGRTVLFVSHNMNAVNRLCNRSILLTNGQISYSGNTSAAIGKYLDQDKTAKKIVTHVLFNKQNYKDIHIREASLVDENGELLKGPVSVTERFFLIIVYVVKRPIKQLHLNFYIRNFQDDIVLFSDRRDNAKSYLNAKPGSYDFSIEIPNPALVQGTYKISIGAVNRDNDFSEQRPNCLSFEIIDLESIRSERPGFIFVPVKWKQNYERA